MASVKNAKTIQSVDGRSFVPILKDPSFTDKNRALFWHTPNKWTPTDGPGINYFSAIRKGDWKMVYSIRTGKKELYNLKSDIGETTNVSRQNPVILNELSAQLFSQLKIWQSPMPINKQTGSQVNYGQ